MWLFFYIQGIHLHINILIGVSPVFAYCDVYASALQHCVAVSCNGCGLPNTNHYLTSVHHTTFVHHVLSNIRTPYNIRTPPTISGVQNTNNNIISIRIFLFFNYPINLALSFGVVSFSSQECLNHDRARKLSISVILTSYHQLQLFLAPSFS